MSTHTAKYDSRQYNTFKRADNLIVSQFNLADRTKKAGKTCKKEKRYRPTQKNGNSMTL